MRTILKCCIPALFLALSSPAQSQSLKATLGTGWFVQGMTEVKNAFVVENPPLGTIAITYRWYQPQTKTEVAQRIDANPSNGWAQDVDMGEMVPGTNVIAYCIGVLDTLAIVGPLPLNIIERPDWLIEGTARATSLQPDRITFTGFAPIDGIIDGIVDPSVTGFGNRRVQMLRLGTTFTGVLNSTSRETSTSPPAIQFGIDIFRQGFALRDIPTDATVALDTNFNLAFKAEDSIRVPLFKITLPKIYIPILSFADIQIDAGARFSARLKGRVVFGESDGQWGFIRHDSQATTLAAFLDCHGWFRGSLNILWGILASARGTINLDGTLGAGIEYTSVPTSLIETKFGGSLRITGEASARFLFWDVWSVGPTELYSGSFGTMPGKIIGVAESPFLRASTVALDRAFLTPTYDPRPLLCTNGDDLGVAWIEQSSTASTLFISKIGATSFSTQAPLPTGIANTATAMAPNGTMVVAYATSRYTSATTPSDKPIADAMRAMDIEYAIVPPAGTLQRYSIPDDRSSAQSGRADGMPAVSMLNADSALLVWSVLRPNSTGTELWYSVISIHDGGGSSPMLLTTYPGSHYSPTVSTAGNGAAMVVWVIDPDTTMATGEKQLASKLLANGQWQPTEIIPTSDGDITAVRTAGAGNYLVLGWIEQLIDSSGSITSGLRTKVYNAQQDGWQPPLSYVENDSLNDLRNLSVGVNQKGQMAISAVRVPWDVDTSDQSQGKPFFLTNSADQHDQWKWHGDQPFFGDTTRFVWQSQLALLASGDMALLTEEHGNNSEVAHGKKLGNPDAGIVLRMLNQQPDGSIVDSQEPTVPTTGTPMEQDMLTAIRLHPNPTLGFTTLRFTSPTSGYLSIEIMDALGLSVGTVVNADIEAGVYESRMDVSELPAGHYHVIIRMDGMVKTIPIVVL
ncbi:MAG: T9SS type A sorting domain-containing protein [Chlorobi bacterium]|nr:T9SS type A sorting domain-containing protein [Chlorobiota bacterium]